MSMFLDQPMPFDLYPLEEVALEGPSGGPTYRYRGADIECLKGGRVCRLSLSGHPVSGSTFSTPGVIMPLVDFWIEKQQLPGYMRR